MKKTHNCMLTVLALLALGITAQAQDVTRAQDQPIRESPRAAGPAVTISVTERGVRFAALGSFGKMRLEVFNAHGTSLYKPFRVRGQIMDRPGTIIGKALESLDKGEGTILVLLSLQ